MATNEETLNSSAYVLGVTKEKLIQSLFKVFYNRIVNNVTDPHSPTRSKWWYPAFPDVNLDNSEAYPIGVINSPEISWDKFTLTKKTATATINVEVYVTKQKQLDELADAIINAVETSSGIFRNIQIRFTNLDDTSTDHTIRDKITIHSKIMSFTCTFNFTTTIGTAVGLSRNAKLLNSNAYITGIQHITSEAQITL